MLCFTPRRVFNLVVGLSLDGRDPDIQFGLDPRAVSLHILHLPFYRPVWRAIRRCDIVLPEKTAKCKPHLHICQTVPVSCCNTQTFAYSLLSDASSRAKREWTTGQLVI